MKVSSLTIEMAANVARLQKDMDQARRVVESTMGRVSATASIAAKALGLLGVAGGVSGLVSMARNVGQTAREIERLSAVANADAQTLQKWGYATQTVGMNQEKLSDVLKDVTDKVGEFLSTGGGPMKDFFEQIAPKVGVSADMFRKLSGPESLQLYVSSLEKAGVGQKQATFYMEALANDATALLPLLKNNGAAMNALASEAVNMGLVMSNEAREQAKELARQSEILDAQMQGVRTTIASELLPVTLEIARQFVSLNGNSRSLASTVGGMLRDSLRSVYSAGVGVVTVFHTAGKVVGGVMALLSTNISAMVQVASRVIKGDFRGAWDAATAAAASGKSIMVGIADDVSAMWVDSGAKINGVWAETAKVAASGSQSMEDSSRRGAQASKEAARAAAAELKAQRALYADLLGVSADYVEQLARIQTMRLSGALTDEQANEAATRLIERQREAGAIMEQNARWMEESAKANESAYEEQAKRVEALQEELKAQLQANEAMGLSATALAELEAARQRDTAAELERRAAMMDGIDPSIAKLYREQAKSLRELADARVAGATKQVAVEAAKKAEEAWKATTDQISQGLTDALMRGFESGKGFGESLADSIVNTFKTYVAREIAKAISNAILSAIAGQNWAGLIGGALGGNGGSGYGSLLSGANNASSLTSAYNTFANGAGSNYGAAASWATGGMSTANALGSIYANTATAGLATGSIAASGAGIDALLATNAAYGTAATGAASGMAGASSAISAIPGWGWVAIAAMALWEPLFGRKLKEVGTQINFREGDISTNDYKFEKGGWFRSDKTTMLGDTTAANKQLVQQAENIQESAKGMARALGFGTDAIDSFSGTVNVNMKGVKSNEEAAQRYNEALQDLNRQMINAATGANYTKEQFDAMMSGIQEDMAAVGISAEGIADILVQGMMGKLSRQEVGDALADMMVGGIYESIAQNYAGQIAQAFTGQIITPIFTALAAGVPISQAISQQAIANVVATAQQAAAALNAIFNDAGFKAAIAGIQQAIGGVAGAVTKVKIPSFGSARSVRGAASGPSPAQIEADRIAKEREGLERQLLQLQGDTVELRRRELQELAPANRALQERIWALEEEQRISQEREGIERRMLELNGRQAQLRAMDLAALDASNRALQEHVWALEDQANAASQAAGLVRNLMQALGDTAGLRQMELEATNPAAMYLQEALWAVEDAAAAEDDARQKVEEAKSALRDAYERERGEIQQTIDKFDAFARSLKAFRQQLLIDNNSPLSLTQRQAEAERQFADVARRARLGDVDAIEELQGISSDYLAVSMDSAKSAEDYYRSFAKVQNVIEDTESLAQRQIDVANSQLSALERQVAAQIDINNSVLSVEAAVNQVVSSIGALAAATTAKESATAAAQQAVAIYKEQLNQQQIALNAIGGDTSAANSAAANEVRALYESIGRVGNLAPSLAEIAYWAKQNASGDALKISFLSAASGATGVYASSAEIANELLKGIRGYASGGVHSGGLRIVGENGPELELTGPSRIWSAEQTQRMLSGSANDELVAEVRQLRKEMAEMKSAAAATARNSNDTVKILQRVTNGGNAMLTEAVA